jgi:archaeal flagellar protein FlaG
MSAETFTTAMFLITAVIAAGVLINAIFPTVYTMAGTFQSATHESDQRLRTDFKIVTYQYASSGTYANKADIWMKNTGSARVSLSEIARSDVFCGPEGNFGRLQYTDTIPDTGQWTTEFSTGADNKKYDLNSNGYWDSGETLHIIAYPETSTPKGETVYFQFILSDGIWRSTTFSAS